MTRIALIAALLHITGTAHAGLALSATERLVDWRHEVADVTAPTAVRDWARQPDVVWFDVRTPAEYGVSHLPGAQRLDPEMTVEAFVAEYGQAVAGQRVVFYCTVGQRSSELADRLMPALEAAGARAVRNLRGGIMRWQQADGPLENADGATDVIHPYNATWQRLAPNPDKTVLPARDETGAESR